MCSDVCQVLQWHDVHGFEHGIVGCFTFHRRYSENGDWSECFGDVDDCMARLKRRDSFPFSSLFFLPWIMLEIYANNSASESPYDGLKRYKPVT
jgi:hypothetical protein